MDGFLLVALNVISGAILMFLFLFFFARKHAQKNWYENPLTAEEKRLIREAAKDITGRDFVWSRDGRLALWK